MAGLGNVEPRTLNLMLIGLTVLAATAMFMYLIWPQAKVLRASIESRATLQDVAANDFQLDKTLTALRGRVAALRKQLHGDTENLPSKEMESYIIGRLQEISYRNRVELAGVRPGVGEPIDEFQEILFEVELAGDYRDLFRWLRSVGDELGFVVVKRYEMSPRSARKGEPLLEVKLTMAVYRAQTG